MTLDPRIVRETLEAYQPLALRDKWSDGLRNWTYLVSGPESSLERWWCAFVVELFDRRGQTLRCRHWLTSDLDPIAEALRIVQVAVECDVTLQLLAVGKPIAETRETYRISGGATAVVRSLEETYPLLHLGSHGMKWTSREPRSKR